MDNFKGVLLLLVLFLGASTFFLFVRSTGLAERASDAEILGQRTLALLKAQDVRCKATYEQFEMISECIGPLLRAEDFKQDSFGQPRKEEPGYLVIKNVNKRSYEAEKFTFYVDRQLVQTGCTIPGSIDYDVACRFNFEGECKKGSVLEVYYPLEEDVRVFLKTC